MPAGDNVSVTRLSPQPLCYLKTPIVTILSHNSTSRRANCHLFNRHSTAFHTTPNISFSFKYNPQIRAIDPVDIKLANQIA